jgi:hypothetical protein
MCRVLLKMELSAGPTPAREEREWYRLSNGPRADSPNPPNKTPRPNRPRIDDAYWVGHPVVSE